MSFTASLPHFLYSYRINVAVKACEQFGIWTKLTLIVYNESDVGVMFLQIFSDFFNRNT